MKIGVVGGGVSALAAFSHLQLPQVDAWLRPRFPCLLILNASMAVNRMKVANKRHAREAALRLSSFQ